MRVNYEKEAVYEHRIALEIPELRHVRCRSVHNWPCEGCRNDRWFLQDPEMYQMVDKNRVRYRLRFEFYESLNYENEAVYELRIALEISESRNVRCRGVQNWPC